MHVKIASQITLNVIAFMHARCKKNEDNISVMLEWSCKEVCFQKQLTCFSRMTDKASSLTFFSTSQKLLQKIPFALLGGLSIWRKQTQRETTFQIERDFLSQLSCDWWEIILFKTLCQMCLYTFFSCTFAVSSSQRFSMYSVLTKHCPLTCWRAESLFYSSVTF